MPPKTQRIQVEPAGARRSQNQGYARALLSEITAPENRSVIIAVGMFAAGVAFLNSPWIELLYPPA